MSVYPPPESAQTQRDRADRLRKMEEDARWWGAYHAKLSAFAAPSEISPENMAHMCADAADAAIAEAKKRKRLP